MKQVYQRGFPAAREEGEPMKRLLALVALAGLAVALYAATATGGQQAVTPKQFAALKKQVTTMQKDVNVLKGFVANCIGVIGVTRFGGTSAGYHYKQPDGSEILTSALDVSDQGETASGLLATIDQQCVQSNALRLARLGVRVAK
jgi:hypothetical protein